MPDYPERFEEFWKHYPRKVAKPVALRAWTKQGVEKNRGLSLLATEDLKKRTRMSWWNKDPTKIPHPSSWINAQRWSDEGWENEGTRLPDYRRGRSNPVGQGRAHQQALADQEPAENVPWEESLIGRIFRMYVLTAGGLPSTKLALKVKAELMRDYVPGYRESVAAEEMTPNEVCAELADLFVRRMDATYGLALGDRVLAAARSKTA